MVDVPIPVHVPVPDSVRVLVPDPDPISVPEKWIEMSSQCRSTLVRKISFYFVVVETRYLRRYEQKQAYFCHG